jgi:hypothetical protein
MPVFARLLVFSLATVALMCGTLLLASDLISAYSVLIGVALIISHASLSATMVVFNSGIWRAYGIGFLAATLLAVQGGTLTFGWSLAGQPFFGSRRGPQFWAFVPIAILHLFLNLNGVLCAGYVWFLQWTKPKPENRAAGVTADTAQT